MSSFAISGRSLLLLVIAGLMAACRPPSSPVVPETPANPSEAVSGFFASYRGNFREADSSFLSKSLREAIASAVSTEAKSRAAIAASAFPSDKPQLIEGEIFSGLYEGFTGFKVGEAQTNGVSAATVDVQFTNNHYSVAWTDRVQLVNENGWKIDDVRYLDKKAGALGLRDVFRDFSQVAAQDPLLNPPAR
jgi:hypothetical protein